MRLKRFRHRLVNRLVWLITSSFRPLPFAVTRFFLGQLGIVGYYLVYPERRKVLGNLAIAYGDSLSERERRRIAKRLFRNYGYGAAEFLQFPRGDAFLDSLRIDIEGREYLDWVVEEGRGCVFVTAHAGNWELLGAWLAREGYPVNVVARLARHSNLRDLLRRHREAAGVRVFERATSTYAMIRVLRRGEGLGLLADVDSRKVDGMFVEFFGRPAFTPIGPARLAARTGAPLLVGFIARLGSRTHRLVVLPPVTVVEHEPGSPKEKDIPSTVRYYTREIERWVREYPDQWIWTHPRWRTRPPEENDDV